MRRISSVLVALALAGVSMAPAQAASARIGGPCKKVHQVDWIKGVRAQCTWVAVPGSKKGKLVWKALAPAKTTVSKSELLGTTETSTAKVETPTAGTPSDTATNTDTATAKP